jgi:flagellin-like hook-associated protein FlgL
MESQMRGMNVAIRNSQDGISLVQTAEAGMGEITNMIIRMRELAVQMNNGVYTSSDRANAQLEINALLAEVDKIAENTAFNDVKVLDGTYSKNIRAGNTNPEVILVAIDSMKTDALAAVAPVSNETTGTGTASNYAIVSADVAVSAQEAFRVTIGAPAASSTGTELEKFAAIYTGGTYTLGGTNSADYTIAADGSITSNSAVSYSSGGSNEVALTRTYTSADGAESFSEAITLTVTEDTAKSLIRTSTSALSIAASDAVTINAVDVSDTSGGDGTGTMSYTTAISQGSLSAALVAFINASSTSSTPGVFSLNTAGSNAFDLNTATGQMTMKTGVDLTSAGLSGVELTYTSANGDAFVETINITAAPATQVSTTLNINSGDTGDITFDATNRNYVSAELVDAVAAASGAVTYRVKAGTTDANINGNAQNFAGGTTMTIGKGVTATSFEIEVLDGASVVFTETVNINKSDTSTASTHASATLVGAQTATSIAANVTTDSNGTGVTFDLTSLTYVSQTLLDRVAAATGTVTYTLAGAGVTSNKINGGTGAVTGTDFNIAHDAHATTDDFTITVKDGATTVHVETVDISVTTGAGSTPAYAKTGTDTTTASTSTSATTLNLNDVADFTLDLTDNTKVSQLLIDRKADTAGAVVKVSGTGVTNGTVNGGNPLVAGGSSIVVDALAASGDNFDIEIYASNGTTLVHTETVTLTVTDISGANTTSGLTAATNVTGSLTATNTAAINGGTYTPGAVGLDNAASVTAGTSDSTAGANARATSALSAVESNRVKVELANLSSQFAAYVAANTGGEYTISGTDAALFDINATTGEVTSKSGLDFEAATDGDTDNQYDFTITYTSGTNSYKEVVALTVTDFADDNGSTLKDVDLSTQTGAASAVDILDSALSQISSSQAKLGAIQNRLQHNIDNLSMASMLTETSRGRIVDADFARETSELSKQQILNQAATSMLAQANQSKQSVLALLQ